MDDASWRVVADRSSRTEHEKAMEVGMRQGELLRGTVRGRTSPDAQRINRRFDVGSCLVKTAIKLRRTLPTNRAINGDVEPKPEYPTRTTPSTAATSERHKWSIE
jgi:hypothetical protein